MIKKIEFINIIPEKKYVGKRLDQTLAQLFPHFSRSLIKKWILNKNIIVNNNICNKPKKKIIDGEIININAIENDITQTHLQPRNIPLDIIYEDEYLIIINKPSNLVVHPGVGHYDDTLLNALLYYHSPVNKLPRAGIIHRLDKDTTGLIIVAKIIFVYQKLIELLKTHKIIREYEAIVVGHTLNNGTVNVPICRHPIKRTHMHTGCIGKHAITHYHIIEKFRNHSRIRLKLETGRTHQIRVHMAYINHPIVGDPLYGGSINISNKASKMLINILKNFNRQALHAIMLNFYHPINGMEMKLHAPVPKDMENLIKEMRFDFKQK